MAASQRRERIVHAGQDGRVNIPADVRRALGLRAKAPVRITLDEEGVRIQPIGAAEHHPEFDWAREAYEAFAPIRKQLERFSEEEIDEWIDEAIREVRAERARDRR